MCHSLHRTTSKLVKKGGFEANKPQRFNHIASQASLLSILMSSLYIISLTNHSLHMNVLLYRWKMRACFTLWILLSGCLLPQQTHMGSKVVSFNYISTSMIISALTKLNDTIDVLRICGQRDQKKECSASFRLAIL